MKPKVYITRKIPNLVLNKIKEFCEVRMWEEEEIPVPRETLLREVRDVDGIYSLLTEQIDEEVLNSAKRLKVIANMAVGYNNINIKKATNKGIIVTNTPCVLTETTADLTFALLMATSRRIVESSEYLRNGSWKTWSPMQLTGQDIHGSNLGIIGMGRIGQSLVKRAKGFDMNIFYHNRSRKLDFEEQLSIEFLEFRDLLKRSDFICVLVPYNSETHHLIGKKELETMKESAVLINTARGGIINEDALYKALKSKEIWAAGLDVFQGEPVSLNNPLLTLSNVVTLPHIGSASKDTRLKMSDLTAENLIAVLNGNRPITPVN